MDLITQAIFFGIAGNFATDAVKAAYKALKDALFGKFSQDSKLVKAVNDFEADPQSDAYKQVLQEKVAQAKANEDTQLLQLAQQVIKLVEEQPGGKEAITINQNVQYVRNAATSGTGNASIGNINESKDDKS